jgi:hypothetical protein
MVHQFPLSELIWNCDTYNAYYDPVCYSVLIPSEKSKIECDLRQRMKGNSIGSASSNTNGTQKTVDHSTRPNSYDEIITSSEKARLLETFFRSVDKSTQINKSHLAAMSEKIATYGGLA